MKDVSSATGCFPLRLRNRRSVQESNLVYNVSWFVNPSMTARIQPSTMVSAAREIPKYPHLDSIATQQSQVPVDVCLSLPLKRQRPGYTSPRPCTILAVWWFLYLLCPVSIGNRGSIGIVDPFLGRCNDNHHHLVVVVHRMEM